MVVLVHPMLKSHFQGDRFNASIEDDFFVFTMYRSGGYSGHVTRII